MASELERFVEAQRPTYESALAELRDGAKRSHWMWFVFPQIAGLGRSATARFYAIADKAEARQYLAHDLLGPRLRECAAAMRDWAGKRSVQAILGPIDAMKFKSSMTLFEAAADDPAEFAAALDELCGGERDAATLERL